MKWLLGFAAMLGTAAPGLAGEISPYLQERARDRIEWRAWGPEAFEEARRDDMPVFVLIGDPACAQCRADEMEAFADPDAVRRLSAGFVAVVVDRFDRPDLADLYAAVLDVPIAGEGRALAVFLLADGRPFAAQSGVARDDQSERPGLGTLVLRRESDFRHDRKGVEAAAARNLARLRDAQRPGNPRGPLGRDVVDAALKGLAESFDAATGGFGPTGGVPAGAPRLLLEANARRADSQVLRMATESLDLLAARGGGERSGVLWLDALLLRGFAQSHAATGSPAHRAAAVAIAARALEEMRDPAGGFFALRRAGPGGPDDRIVAAWNGLMIGALATAGSLLQRPSDVEAAREAARRVLERLGTAASLRHAVRDGTAGGSALLDDYAHLADGLLDLHEATGDALWLAQAVALAEAAIGRFLDPAEGGFFTGDAAHSPMLVRLKHAFDAPLPSGNGVMARVLLRLDRATGEKRYGELARATIDAFRGDLQRAPRGMETLAGATADLLARAERSGDAGTSHPSRRVVGAVTLEASLSTARVLVAAPFEARVRLEVAEGWRVVGREPGVKDLFGLTLSVVGDWLTTDGPRYPEPREEPGRWSTGSVRVHAGLATITVPLRVKRGTPPGEARVGLRAVFQPCDAAGCQPPQSALLEVPLVIEPTP